MGQMFGSGLNFAIGEDKTVQRTLKEGERAGGGG